MTKTDKSYLAKRETVEHKWYLLDAKDQIVGKVAAKAAMMLRGKHKPTFTPSVDTGEYIVIINCDKVRMSGNKETTKLYQSHSGFPGGFKEVNFKSLKAKNSEKILELAIRGMLPKTKLGDQIYSKLKLYKGEKHGHTAQKPELISLAF